MTARAPVIDISTICSMLNDRALEYAERLLPNGRKSHDRRWWETNNIDDNPKKDGGYSLKVEITGPKKGKWRDHADGSHGDILELMTIREFGGDKGAAIAQAKIDLHLADVSAEQVEKVRYQARQRDIAAEEEQARDNEAKKRGARALWLSAIPIEGTAAERYLEARGIERERLPQAQWPGSLRFHEEVWNRDARVKLPAMLATMVTPAGVQVATHRTFLGRDPDSRIWVKADQADIGVPRGQAKMVIGKSGGSFVPIAKGASGRSMGELAARADDDKADPEAIYITEGIEDGLCVAMARPQLRVIAAYSLSNLGAIVFPRAIDPLVIVADRDSKQRAIDALERAIARQQARGKRVQIVMPPPGIKDINDWLRAPQRNQEETPQ